MSDFYEFLRREAQKQMEEAFREAFNRHRGGRDAGYTATGFVHDEAGRVPDFEGSPIPYKVRQIDALRSLARAKGLLPTERPRRVRLFNGRQKQARGHTIELPCTVVH